LLAATGIGFSGGRATRLRLSFGGLGRQGVVMLILALHETPTLTRERYEQVIRMLTGKARIEVPSDLSFEGLLVHAAGEGPNGFLIFDVFESEDAVERFRAAMGTIPAQVGIDEPPKFFPAHTVYLA
jgi:hypothetical protein